MFLFLGCFLCFFVFFFLMCVFWWFLLKVFFFFVGLLAFFSLGFDVLGVICVEPWALLF